MLVLSRKRSERILIGDDVAITIVDIRGGKVRVGIDAPEDVRIMRSELSREAAERLRPIKTNQDGPQDSA